eukprot:6175415-Pleurochrysis_carterae.AAC.1
MQRRPSLLARLKFGTCASGDSGLFAMPVIIGKGNPETACALSFDLSILLQYCSGCARRATGWNILGCGNIYGS